MAPTWRRGCFWSAPDIPAHALGEAGGRGDDDDGAAVFPAPLVGGPPVMVAVEVAVAAAARALAGASALPSPSPAHSLSLMPTPATPTTTLLIGLAGFQGTGPAHYHLTIGWAALVRRLRLGEGDTLTFTRLPGPGGRRASNPAAAAQPRVALAVRRRGAAGSGENVDPAAARSGGRARATR